VTIANDQGRDESLCLSLCAPKTSSELMTRRNRLSWRNDWTALSVLAAVVSPFKSKLRLEAESAVLRLIVLRCTLRGRVLYVPKTLSDLMM
jgi:hypothetical protein